MRTPLHLAHYLGIIPLVFTASATLRAQTIFSSTPVSNLSNQNIAGTTLSLNTNTPGSAWLIGAGWNWSEPTISYGDNPGSPANPPGVAAHAGTDNSILTNEEEVAIGLSLSSAGGYVKPASFTISASMSYNELLRSNNTVGLGFWSVMPLRDDAAHSFDNFTGLLVTQGTGGDVTPDNPSPNNSTIQLYSGGSAGGAIDLGFHINDQTYFTLSYTVDTATSSISGITLNGNAVSGISSNAFTDANTAFTGFLSASGSRLGVNSFSVIAPVPEPSTYALFLGGTVLAFGLRRLHRKKA